MFIKIISAHNKGEHAGSPLQIPFVGAYLRVCPCEMIQTPFVGADLRVCPCVITDFHISRAKVARNFCVKLITDYVNFT